MNVHGMIDLETLGLNCGSAPIMQIGIAAFHPRKSGILASWSCRVTLSSNEEIGREVEPDTEKWWQETPERKVLYDQLIGNPMAVDLFMALANLRAFVMSHEIKEIWANGPAFDVAMVECALRSLKETPIWSHRDVRDTRTIWALAAEKHPPFALDSALVQAKLGWKSYPGSELAHDALSDCLHQILKVQMAYAILDMDHSQLQLLK
jgi:hypothetical protein